MAKKYLSNDGLRYLWAKLKEKLGNKSDIGHTHLASEVSDLSSVIPSTLPANGGNADTVDGYHANVLAKTNTANTFDGEQKYVNSSYAPTVTDSASGVGCAFKASRGLYNEALLDKIIMTMSTGKIPFYKYTGTNSGQMTGLVEVSNIDSNGKYNGDADSIDGYHIRTTTDINDTGQNGYITFIV